MRNDQWSLRDQPAVCMINDDVIEVSCLSPEMKVESNTVEEVAEQEPQITEVAAVDTKLVV